MDIIFFSLCFLCKLVFHVIIAGSGENKTGEKTGEVFCILNFGCFHLQLAGIHMYWKKESAKSRGLRGNMGYMGACVAWVALVNFWITKVKIFFTWSSILRSS